MAKRVDGETFDMFDICWPCQEWQMALFRRRGGQPVRCQTCGRGMKRITTNHWMELLMRSCQPSEDTR